jgi:hypothetical protein
VNDSFGAETPDFLDVGPQMPVPDTLEASDYPEEEPQPRVRREGLPPSFRMRHDKHYVEELMSTPTDRAPSPARTLPAARTTLSDELLDAARPTPERPSAAAVDLIASRIEAAVAHSAISRTHGVSPDLVDRSVQAELQRVARLARAISIAARDGEPQRLAVNAGDLATAVRTACVRVARLNGADCAVAAEDSTFTVAGERALVVQGVAGTVDALLDLACVHGSQDSFDEGGPRITVSLRAVRIRPALIVDISCTNLSLPAGFTEHGFENRDDEFRRAPAAGILLAAAAHVARMHGGRADAKLQAGAVTITYVFPQEAPRPPQ